MTTQQINEFRRRAKAAGKTDAEIETFIQLKKNQMAASSSQPDGEAPFTMRQQPAQQKKSVGGFVGNILKSGGELIKGTAEAIINPIDTAKSIGRIGLGAVEKVVPGRQGAENEFDQLTNFYKERYGSFEKLKETAYNDPVGFASDIATLAGGAGLVAKAGTAAKVGEFSRAAKVASTVNKFTDPLQAVTAIPKAVTPKSFLSATAQKIYQSALKPSTTLSDVDKTKILLTGLREGIPVTSSGLSRLAKELDALNTSIGKVIAQGKKAGDVVKTSEIASYLNEVRARVGKTINGKSRLDDIDEIEQNFLSQFRETIPTDVAQEVKKNTYQVLRKSYGEMKSVAIEAEKALARGIKEELVKKYPQLEYLNARDSALINLEKQLERAVGRIANRDVVGLGTTVASTANPIAGALKALIDNPYVKSKLAIALQKAADRVPRKSRIRRKIVPATRLTQPARESKEESESPEF
jgi:hypothetical protein